MKKILVISTCKFSLHELEFVTPITNILDEKKLNYSIVHISKVNPFILKSNISHVIICGTAIKDFSYTTYTINPFFDKISKLNIPTLGICAGAQLISKFIEVPLCREFQCSSITMKKNEIKNPIINLEQDSIKGFALHSFCIHSRDIENKEVKPLLFSEFEPEKIELASYKAFILSFFHIEIRNKEILKNWISK